MATLEKIRSKSLLLFVIIIVALLAFILGDFLTSGRTYFGSGTTVATAGKAKVDYMDYQNRVNAVADQQRNNQRQQDSDDLSQSVLQQLLLEKMLQNEYNDLGLVVTTPEITEAMTGAVPHPVAQQFIYQASGMLGLPAPSGQTVRDAINNPQKYGLSTEMGTQLREYWAAVEADVTQAILQDKFDALINGLLVANELDAKSAYNDVATTRHISFAAKNINTISDDEVEVTDADRLAAYAQDKENYRIYEPLRAIDYIVVNIEPSQADRTAGAHEVEEAVIALNQAEGTDMVSSNPRFVVNSGSATKARITNNSIKQFLDTAKVGEAKVVSNIGDNFTIVKLLGITSEVDSINLTMIRAATVEAVDSIFAELNSGKTFADVVDNVNVEGQDSVWTTLAIPGMQPKVKNALETNAVGTYFVISDTIQGEPVAGVYRINRRKAPVPYYEYATIDYTIDPSQETLANLSANLRTYVSNNSSAADFAANAVEKGYTVIPSAVQASNAHIDNLSDSRPVVKWVMNAKKGQVMPVYQDNKQTYLLTVAVKDVYNGDYIPYNGVLIADAVNGRALMNKKAQKVIDEYAGKASDVAGYARLMGVEPQDADAMFGSRMVSGIGFNESAIQGAIAAAQPGQVVGPLAGNTSVVVFVVNGEDNDSREFTFDEYANQFNRNFGIGGTRPMQDASLFQLLLGKDKVKNNSIKFIQGHAE